MDKVNPVAKPHDLYFKSTFGKPDFAKGFLNNYLPQDLLAIINLDTLTHAPTTYLSKELKEQFLDLAYQIDIKGSMAYITFLFEHKSYQDRMIILQILKYMVAIWEAKIKNDLTDKNNTGKAPAAATVQIPIIIPIVVYHDENQWKIKKSLGEMMSGFSTLPSSIKKYIPDFEYLLIDITHPQAGNKLNLAAEHAIVLETLGKARYETKERVIDIFKRAIKIYMMIKEKEVASYYIIETIVYIISIRDDFDEIELQGIAAQISKEGGELVMTLAERLIEKGMEKGMEKGEFKKAKEIAKELLINGMGAELVAKYTKLSKEEIEKIKISPS